MEIKFKIKDNELYFNTDVENKDSLIAMFNLSFEEGQEMNDASLYAFRQLVNKDEGKVSDFLIYSISKYLETVPTPTANQLFMFAFSLGSTIQFLKSGGDYEPES